MCGIVGYIGRRDAAPILIDGLYRLEYRGYDSAGIAVLDGGKFEIFKRCGRVKEIEEARTLSGCTGIGHTRWATNGGPSRRNAHPHVYGDIALVHNGIIENAQALKEECLARGESFSSETDSEVIAHLIARADRGDLLRAVKEACSRLKGSYALAVLSAREPSAMVCARMHSPLIVGVGEGELFVASDLPAIAANGVTAYALEDGEFALLRGAKASFYGADLSEKEKRPLVYSCENDAPELCGYAHFMRKEMDEIPSVLAAKEVDFAHDPRFSDLYRVLCQTEYVQIVACGTAYHSGLCAKEAIETLCRVPAEACIASEYRYRDPIVPPRTLCIAVSQSGETADTLAAAKLAKEKGAYLLAVTNVAYCSLTRLCDSVVLTRAGREIAVAATKSFNAQLLVLYALARALAFARGRKAPELVCSSSHASRALSAAEGVRAWTKRFVSARSVYFIGRGVDYCTALEGSLKLKEISYLPSEGYCAGELKHGTLALIGKDTPVVAVITQEALAEKTMNAVHEVKARGADVYLVTCFPQLCTEEFEGSVLLPNAEEIFSPIIAVIPLQMLAYYTALARGCDPDKPRNLAKSVTVE